ncbi:hypothetical protein CJP72_12790 [Citrobacter sp. NCU1]|uniref:hypothetical protein n=1 Tax=Citrobacter sp. NCU1 TaxID=2026683 RepID=UPI001391CA54|nr:hypothetical protein [Citrobacter sp. NCU1]NDO81608.1 hypothetical protein [Citrobacter sp. NCU1]
MTFQDRLEKATLTRILKSKNLQTEKEWLDFYLFGHHFNLTATAYNHYKDKPKFNLGIKFPDHIICVKTEDCFFPKKFQHNTCFEIVILDLSKQQVIYYTLCIGQVDTICPLSWRVADHRYNEFISDTDIDLVILKHLLDITSLCIDHRNMYGGNVWYWNGIIRTLGKNYSVYRLIAPDRATIPIAFNQAELMKIDDFLDLFIEKLASIDNYCFIISK